jgi:hypothetical protein
MVNKRGGSLNSSDELVTEGQVIHALVQNKKYLEL